MAVNPVAESWDQLITDWERNVWPTMAKHGFRKDSAFQCWQLNRVAVLLERATETDDEREVRLEHEAETWRQ